MSCTSINNVVANAKAYGDGHGSCDEWAKCAFELESALRPNIAAPGVSSQSSTYEALCVLSWLHDKCKDHGAAITAATRAIGIDPELPMAHARAGVAHYHAKRLEEATPFLQAAARLCKDSDHRLHSTVLRFLSKACSLSTAPVSYPGTVANGTHSTGKYPSTPHLHFSPGGTHDDLRWGAEASHPLCDGRDVVVTEKLDGANCCLQGGVVYGRTHSHPAEHPSFGPIRSWYAGISYDIDPGLQLFGENMFGIHSIEYHKLTSHFYLFSIRDADGQTWPWDDTVAFAEQHGITMAPVARRGPFESLEQMQKWTESAAARTSAVCSSSLPEGFVFRPSHGFAAKNFGRFMAKYVRANHVQTSSDWRKTWRKATIYELPEASPTSLQEPVPPTHSPGRSTKPDKSSGNKDKRKKGRGLPSLVMLAGLPGSGKSTFGEGLVQSNPERWVRVCQDDVGSRRSVEDFIGSAAKRSHQSLIIDRCNPTRVDRAAMLKLAFRPADAVLVWFAAGADECVSRVKQRTGHPTIAYGGGDRAVKSFAKSWEDPTPSEGFERIHRVSTFEEANTLLSSWGASPPESPALPGFFKFPRTKHIAADGDGNAITRDDLLMDSLEVGEFLAPHRVVAEEKIDGANLGISLTADYVVKCQNRSHFVTTESHSQFARLDAWIQENSWALCSILKPEDEVLFGEWMYAKHSIHYTKLPGHFIAFDIYNKRTGKFCSAEERDRRLSGSGIPVVRRIRQGIFGSVDEMMQLLQTRSVYTDGYVEGVVFRSDRNDQNARRGKIVRDDFVQGITTHWMTKSLTRNMIDHDWNSGEDFADEETAKDVAKYGTGTHAEAGPVRPQGSDANGGISGDTGTTGSLLSPQAKEFAPWTSPALVSNGRTSKGDSNGSNVVNLTIQRPNSRSLSPQPTRNEFLAGNEEFDLSTTRRSRSASLNNKVLNLTAYKPTSRSPSPSRTTSHKLSQNGTQNSNGPRVEDERTYQGRVKSGETSGVLRSTGGRKGRRRKKRQPSPNNATTAGVEAVGNIQTQNTDQLLPPLPILARDCAEADLRSTHAGPTARSNWVIPGRLMAGGLQTAQRQSQLLLDVGVTTFVRLQTKDEIQRSVPYEPRVKECLASAKFRHLPIVDQNVADDARVQELVNELVERIKSGEVLYVHCKGGHGRTGTVCSLLLGTLYKLSANEALRRVQYAHDTRAEPKFAGTRKTGVADALFPVQIEQVRRLLP